MSELVSKFILVENFTFLLGQLAAFDDPQFTYKNMGRPDLRGGERRKYREYVDFAANVQITKSPSPQIVNLNGVNIECDEFHVLHDTYKNPELKEKYPANGYQVLITSKEDFDNKTAQKYYVSCECQDFNTTFKEELIKYGYTAGTTLPSTGKKKLAPAICKHIYSILIKEYKDVIEDEKGVAISANVITWPKAKPQISPHTIIPPTTPPATQIAPQQPIPGQPLTPASNPKKKADYEKVIRKSLKFLNNTMPNNVDIYKNSRQADNSYKKYKFMVKNYPQGSVIVFTNPLLNPFRDKVKDKEIVPLINRTARGTLPFGDAVIVYTKYFNKQELLQFIREESREIQPNQIEKLNKTIKKYTLTESMEVLDTDYTSISNMLLGIY